MKMKLPGMYGITRIDVNGQERAVHAYRVSIQKRNKKFVKYFTDLRSGSRAKAFEEAKAYRDKIVRTTKPFTRAEISNSVKTKNKSGMVGVTYIVKINDRGRKPLKYYYWKAWWSPEAGKPKTAAFSVNKYGYEGALELAKKARLKGLKEMKGLDLSFLKLSKLRTKTRIHKR